MRNKSVLRLNEIATTFANTLSLSPIVPINLQEFLNKIHIMGAVGTCSDCLKATTLANTKIDLRDINPFCILCIDVNINSNYLVKYNFKYPMFLHVQNKVYEYLGNIIFTAGCNWKGTYINNNKIYEIDYKKAMPNKIK